jgi:hypothetical protein
MNNVIVGKDHESRRPAIGSGFVCFIATVSTSSIALIFGIVVDLSWPEYVMLTITAAALTVGGVVTIFEMRSLAEVKR